MREGANLGLGPEEKGPGWAGVVTQQLQGRSRGEPRWARGLGEHKTPAVQDRAGGHNRVGRLQ